MSTTIKTTGDLRRTLADTLIGVRDGETDFDAARTMVKLASQINENYYVELKAAQVAIEAGNKAAELGKLSID